MTDEEIEVRQLPDEDVAHWCRHYRRELARSGWNDEATAWYEYKVALFGGEEDRRRRLVARGIAYHGDRYPESFLRDLKRRVNLDGVIETHFGVTLSRRNGADERRCACPIHPGADNPRNFVVYLADPDNEHYVCQRCRAGGDVFAAIMQSHGVDFRGAVEILAAYCGVTLPAKQVPPAARGQPPRKLGGTYVGRGKA